MNLQCDTIFSSQDQVGQSMVIYVGEPFKIISVASSLTLDAKAVEQRPAQAIPQMTNTIDSVLSLSNAE